MLRIEVMGLEDSITRDPTGDELRTMVTLLERAMEEGYPGFSTDSLPLHFLAAREHVSKRIPTQYAAFDEYRALTDVVRRHGRVWQMTPATDDARLTLKLMFLTSGRLYGRPLKVTALAALDTVNNRATRRRATGLARLLNTRLVDGRFRMQALAAPFRIWSEGAVSPLAEGDPLMRRLIETELEDREARRRILEDPAYVEAFREMWSRGKSGFGIARLKRLLRLEDDFLTRDLDDMVVYRSPVPEWEGLSLAAVHARYQSWRRQGGGGAGADEQLAFEALGRQLRDDGEFFLALLRHFDRDLYWHYVQANRDPAVIKQLLLEPELLPGFNDSGAHVTNMAFYDGNLRALALALAESETLFSRMVGRLTREPAEFFGLDAGRIDVGSRADITLLNPDRLAVYDGEANVRYQYRAAFECHQLVNRSDGVVAGVWVGGRQLWDGADFTPAFGRDKAGCALRAV